VSAWLTSDVHVSAIVQQACVEGLIPFSEADQWWARAKWQNHYALHCRYGDTMPCDDAEDMKVRRTSVEAELHPGKVYDLVRCWNYQCAEFADYEKTPVSILMEGLGQVLAAKHPEMFDAHDDGHGGVYYTTKDQTCWGIVEWDEVIWIKENSDESRSLSHR